MAVDAPGACEEMRCGRRMRSTIRGCGLGWVGGLLVCWRSRLWQRSPRVVRMHVGQCSRAARWCALAGSKRPGVMEMGWVWCRRCRGEGEAHRLKRGEEVKEATQRR